ncbi:MAG: nucleotidyltransferase family protein [Melioribacteraceae bacterium]
MITLSQAKKVLRKNKSYLQQKYYVDEIGIFGSYTRGEQNSKSDIDLLVSFRKPIGLEFVDLSEELEELLNHKVDLVSKGALKKRMYEFIKQEIVYV